MMREEYMEKLVQCIRQAGLDGMLICPGEEMRFLTGFSPMFCERFQGLFVKADGTAFYVCNLLYGEEMREQLPPEVPVYTWFDGDVMPERVKEALKEQGLLGGRIGVNRDAVAFQLLEIKERADIIFCDGKPLMEEMRIRKSGEELENLRRSAAIVDQVFLKVLDRICPGVTEASLQEFLLEEMSRLGGESPECIVGIGANSSYPHYCGSSGRAKQQDVVLMDYGCTCGGMYSDISRTVFVGEPTKQQREAYELVKRANLEAESLVKEGAWIPDIDRRAREVLDEKGYAWTMINRLGHGIGYTIHEAPDIKQSHHRKLERGMAFSIEPGIYLGGEFGIRIEDVVIVNEAGEREVLNQASKELIIL